MVPILHDVAQQHRWGVHVVQHGVHVTIIEQIAESAAARGNYVGQAAASCRRNFLEFCSVQISKELWTFSPGRAPIAMIHRGVHVSVRDENVQQCVVVKIYESDSPCEKWNGWTTQPGWIGDI